MTNKNLSEISNEDLIKNEKKVRGLALAFMGTLIVLFVALIFLTLTKGFTALIITPIALIPILIVSLKNWNDLKKEIKARNL